SHILPDHIFRLMEVITLGMLVLAFLEHHLAHHMTLKQAVVSPRLEWVEVSLSGLEDRHIFNEMS
ncbi:MAG: hypothetical protein ACREDS_06335, partial [Limisphaerales bacterium]